ncbi:MAG: hypothetical protein OXI16_13915 [Chloroflexota bacterium]|nr:hypothetical protein [Chloroflexota bacterium]
MTTRQAETTSLYVTCNCSANNIQLNLPILTLPDGKHIACVSCFADIEKCPPAPIADVLKAGLPLL